MINLRSIVICFLLINISMYGTDTNPNDINILYSTKKHEVQNDEQSENAVLSIVCGILSCIPLVCGGLIFFDGNIPQELGELLVCGSVGGALAYKGYKESSHKNIYSAVLGSACTLAMYPSIAQKITEHKHK